MFERHLNLKQIVELSNIFLFGPRQTGKSTLIQATLPNSLYLDLLSRKTFQQLSADPDLLHNWVSSSTASVVVIDEIQKLPFLTDTVQQLIQKFGGKKRFILTGSSARKLRRSGANLLGGRAAQRFLFPLLLSEIVPQISDFILNDAIQWGTLPSVVGAPDRRLVLDSYLSLYLDQEIRAEGLARSIDLFSRFLETAALCNGQQINFSKLASDVGRSEKTVAQWFSILEDTLIGHLLPAFQGTLKRKAMTGPKFFFFDCGVANALLSRYSLSAGTPEYGSALENLVFTHLAAKCAYGPPGVFKVFYWRSSEKHEVDFIVTQDRVPVMAIEVKSTETPKKEHFVGLREFAADFPDCKKILLCRVPFASETDDGIKIIPVREFLVSPTLLA